MLHLLNIIKAGCVHFVNASDCDVRILLLIFSPRKRAFVGLIPNDQVTICLNKLTGVIILINQL